MKKERVAIPEQHFLNEAKSEYWDYQSRLVAEVIQNSYDAGASEIHLNFEDDYMEFIDNGKGMDYHTMREGMLTLGGSIKDKGNTGGFGAAKKILLFSHKSYEIHSLNNHIQGNQLDYDIIEGEDILGTSIKIKPFEGFAYRKDGMIYKAKEFLRKCDLNSDVYINNNKFDNYLSLPEVRETELITTYSQDERGKNEILVRANGLFMFSRYLTSLNMKVVCEVKKPSKESFSQSRDSLKGVFQKEFDALVDELNVDKMSFKTKGIRKRIFRGAKSFLTFLRSITTPKDQILSAYEKKEMKTLIEQVSNKTAERNESEESLSAELVFEEVKKNNIVPEEKFEKIKSLYNKEEKLNIDYDFLVDLKNSDHDETPEEYHPKSISFENEQIALLWRECIKEISKICNFKFDFSIGFTLSKFNEAMVTKEGSGFFFLINPEILKGKYDSLDERYLKTLLVACHECVHVGYGKKLHDEEFSSLFEDTTTKVLLSIDKREIWSRVESSKL